MVNRTLSWMGQNAIALRVFPIQQRSSSRWEIRFDLHRKNGLLFHGFEVLGFPRESEHVELDEAKNEAASSCTAEDFFGIGAIER